jgi:hypothetical protein
LFTSNSRNDRLADSSLPALEDSEGVRRAAKREKIAGIALLSTGAAALATGIGLYWFGSSANEAIQPMVQLDTRSVQFALRGPLP